MPDAPYPPPDGYQLVLQDMAEKNPKAAQADVKDYIDSPFVKGTGRLGVYQKPVAQLKTKYAFE